MAGQNTKNKLASVSNYDEQYIKQQINQGKEFTHYGGGNKQTENQQQSNKQGQTPNNQGGSSGNTAVNVPQENTQNDIQLMTNAAYGEARAEPCEEQYAVARVVVE